MKKYIYAALISGLTLVAHTVQAENFNGFHAGIGLASQTLSVNETIAGVTAKVKKSKTNLGARVFAGYDFQPIEGMVIGGEVGYTKGGNSALKVTNTALAYTAKTTPAFDYSIRAGGVFGEGLLIYGRLGQSRFDVKKTTKIGAATIVASTSKQTANLVGLGAELALGESMGVRVEYDQVKGKKGMKNNQFAVSGVWKF